jgi:hypothetical protein
MAEYYNIIAAGSWEHSSEHLDNLTDMEILALLRDYQFP